MRASLPADSEGAKSLVRALRQLPENRVCLDCPQRSPGWCSVTFGAFLCMDCCGRHRGMGVHVSFMRSADLDSWRPEEALRMALGGNDAARQFFKQHGCSDPKLRYTSSAAQTYRKKLDRLLAERIGGAAAVSAEANAEKAQAPLAEPLSTEENAQKREETETAGSPVLHTPVTTLSKGGMRKGGGAAAKKRGFGGAHKVEGVITETSDPVPASLLYDDTKKPVNVMPDVSTAGETEMSPTDPADRFKGVGNPAFRATPTSDFPEKNDFSGAGSMAYSSHADNSRSSANNTGLQDTLWQVSEAWDSLKDSATRSREVLGNKIKGFLDDL